MYSDFRMAVLAKIILIILLFSSISYSQGWQLINPLPTEAPVEQIFFLDAQVGWLRPFNNTLLFTSDSGENWETLYPDLLFHDVHFLNEHIGWAIAQPDLNQNDRQVYFTDNGGNSWQLFAPSEFVDDDIFFIDEQRGWAGGSGRLLHTKDGGQTWEHQATNLLLGRGAIANNIVFIDSLRGWVATSIDVIRTQDGGQNWEVDPIFTNVISMFTIYNSTHIWAISRPFRSVWYSNNGGVDWNTSLLSDTTGFDLRTNFIHAVDQNTVFAATNFGTFISTDGGVNWDRTSQQQLTSIYGLTESKILGSNAQNGIPLMYKSEDGGSNWDDLMEFNNPNGSGNYNSIEFVTSDTGFIAGSTGFLTSTVDTGFVLRSVDGGQSWMEQLRLPNTKLVDIAFSDERYGWALAETGCLYRTNNSGNSWELQDLNTQFLMREICVVDSLYAWTVGLNLGSSGFEGEVWATKNGGQSWIPQANGQIESALFTVYFADTLNGWVAGGSGAVGETGTIRFTQDGGQTWSVQFEQTGAVIRDIVFTDVSFGWAAGSFTNPASSLLYTVDGGVSWQPFSGVSAPLTELFFLDYQTGWGVGPEGNIYNTTDGGLNWMRQPSQTYNALTDLEMITRNKGWVVGTSGLMLQTETGGVVGISPDFKERGFLPVEISLKSYPNPFNPKTSIAITTSSLQRDASLYVSDILGRNIQNIYDGHLPAGISYFTWDGTNHNQVDMASGLYFLTLRTYKDLQTIKLLKIK